MSLYFALERAERRKSGDQKSDAPPLLNSEHSSRIRGASLRKVEGKERIHMSRSLFGLFGRREEKDASGCVRYGKRMTTKCGQRSGVRE